MTHALIVITATLEKRKMDVSLFQEGEPGQAQELKKNMFLDFTSGNSNTRQQRLSSLLASPDLSMLKTSSPEIERMLALLQTPTPTQFLYPKQVTDEQEAYASGFIRALAELQREEQLQGATSGQHTAPTGISTDTHDFSKSNLSLPQSTDDLTSYSHLMPMSTGGLSSASSSAATTLASMSAFGSMPGSKRPYQFVPSNLVTPSKPFSTIPSTSLDTPVKNEPSASSSSYVDLDHTVPTSMQASPTPSSSRFTDSPALSPSSTINMDNDNMPIDMNNQEVIKVERKRARNRIAARKCRTRKLERISRLEEKVNDLKTKNNELLQHATSLNDQVVQLKQQIMDHMKTGCQIIMPS